MNNFSKRLAGLTLGLLLTLSVGVAGGHQDVVKTDAAETKTLIIDGSQLPKDAAEKESTLTYGDYDIVFSKGAKYQGSTGTNRFSDKAMLIGKSGAYVYNKTPIGSKITKFEVYANSGASTKVSIGINFSDTAIKSYSASASNTYTATLSTVDKVYDASDKLSPNAQYFWYQVTNSNNSQVQFRITYEDVTPTSSLVSIALSGQTTEYYVGDEFSFDGKCTATFEDESTLSVTPTSVTKPDMTTAGDKNIEVSYTDPNDATNTKTASYIITVNESPIEGEGTETNPYTVSDAYFIASRLDSNSNNGKVVYVTGKVTGENMASTTYGFTFDITDGTKTVIAYSITGAQTTDSSKTGYIAKDYTVVITGAIIRFDGTDGTKYEVGYTSGYNSSIVSSTAPETSFKITGAPTTNIETGATGQLGVDKTGLTITWASSNTDVLTITADGKYTAVDGGLATVTATNTATEEKVEANFVVNYGVLTVDKAYELTNALSGNITTAYMATVSGKIVSTKSTKSTQNEQYKYEVTFKTSADKEFKIFFGYMDNEPEGFSSWVAGATLTVKGNLCKYYSTMELTNVSVISYSFDADGYVSYFTTKLASVCSDVEKDNSEVLKPVWTDLKAKWADVDEASKETLKNAATDDATYGEFAKKYDHIMGRYGEAKLGEGANFIGRSVTTSVSTVRGVLSNADNSLTITIIVLVSVISVSLIVGTTLIIRKRKFN